jgi:CBS domain-containing protein
MQLSDLFARGMICDPMQATTRHEAICELVELLVAQTPLDNPQALIAAIEEREEIAETALGRNVAFPHARTHLTDQLYVVLGVLPHGIPWGNQSAVRLIFLFVTPLTVTSTYISTLAAVSELLHRPGLPDALVQAGSGQAVLQLIRRAGVRITVFRRARDIMIHDVISIGPGETVRDLAHLLVHHNISGMPVVDGDDRVIGVVSEKDVLVVGMPKLREFFDAIGFHATFTTVINRLLAQEDILVGDIMNCEIVCADENTEVVELARMLVDQKVRRIPVVRKGKLVGIVGRADIIRNVIRKVGVR